ncbi:MAG TPA: DUF3187 family protein [Fontimonas sp.]
MSAQRPLRFRPALLRCSALLTLAGLASSPAQAREAFVFPSFNQSALARYAALPTPAASHASPGPRFTLDWTSESIIDAAGSETLVVDGEILRLGLQYQARWAGMDWGIEVPLLFAGGGMLDAAIESWHDTFGLPDGGRKQLPRDDYRYAYARDGVLQFDVNQGASTVGDIRLGAARCQDSGGCLRGMLQLPVADADELLGGGLGAALWYEQPYVLGASERWTGVIAAGLSAQRSDGPLQDQQRALLPFGWASLGYALTESVDAGLQFYAHAPLYDDSELESLSEPGGLLSFGLSYRQHGGTLWRLAVVEDVITETSPDFVIHFSADFGTPTQ